MRDPRVVVSEDPAVEPPLPLAEGETAAPPTQSGGAAGEPLVADAPFTLLEGDVIDVLRGMPDGRVSCVMTSPPYYGLRSYGIPTRQWDDGEVCVLGDEATLEGYLMHLVEVFREVKRVLHPTGSMWLNLGDCYAGGGRHDERKEIYAIPADAKPTRPKQARFAGKDLLLIPARAAMALQDDGWILRQDNIWAKALSFLPSFSGSVMPESTRDRTTWAHEHVWHFVKPKENLDALPLLREDAIWLAAMIDGEGCITITKTPARDGTREIFSPWIVITSTSVKLIERVASICRKPPVQRGGSRLPAYHVRITHNDAARLLRAVRPYLVEKGVQADLVLALQATRLKNGITRSDSVIEYQRRLWTVCKELHRGGSPDLSWVRWEKPVKKECGDYFYDQDGCREAFAASTTAQLTAPYRGKGRKDYAAAGAQNPSDVKRRVLEGLEKRGGRNLRNVWVIPKQNFPGSHFATFPERLVEPVVRLGSSPKGVCARCAAPMQRSVERERTPVEVQEAFEASRRTSATDTGRTDGHTARRPSYRRKVLGESWEPSCGCGAGVVPATVLDIFSGSGRTGVVALREGRRYIGIDINPAYHAIARAALTGHAAGAGTDDV